MAVPTWENSENGPIRGFRPQTGPRKRSNALERARRGRTTPGEGAGSSVRPAVRDPSGVCPEARSSIPGDRSRTDPRQMSGRTPGLALSSSYRRSHPDGSRPAAVRGGCPSWWSSAATDIGSSARTGRIITSCSFEGKRASGSSRGSGRARRALRALQCVTPDGRPAGRRRSRGRSARHAGRPVSPSRTLLGVQQGRAQVRTATPPLG